MRRFLRSAVVAGVLVIVFALPSGGAADQGPGGPPLSIAALFSRFAREQGLAPDSITQAPPPSTAIDTSGSSGTEPEQSSLSVGADSRVNQDFSLRPQNETTIAVNPWSPNMLVGGANDYRLGAPLGAAFYTSFDAGFTWNDGFPPFPLLAFRGGDHSLQVEPPFGTGDPVITFGQARSGSPGVAAGTRFVYYAYLGVSASFCEHGIFVSRSVNGLLWTRPVTPPQSPPLGLFTPVYWDRPDDCTVFNDKPSLAVDRSGGPHDGRVYVSWSRFAFSGHHKFQESPILLSYSDDNGESWSSAQEVSGVSPGLCQAQVAGKSGRCDEDQFSSLAVGPDGTLYVAFLNQQLRGAADGFRNQYLITNVNPDTHALSGPYQAATLIDGRNEFPVNDLQLATLCNSNFRFNSAGNLAIDPSDPAGKTLYLVFADNRNGSAFPSPTTVTQTPPDSFSCPPGQTTDTDIFMVRSDDGGLTWHDPSSIASSPVRVNQDPLHSGKDQWFPAVALAADGRVDVMFCDRREDPFDRFANVYLARSHDHGATWTEVKVSSVPSNMNWAFENGEFMGDYNTIAVAPDGSSYPFWTDARNGTPSIRQSDVFIARVGP